MTQLSIPRRTDVSIGGRPAVRYPATARLDRGAPGRGMTKVRVKILRTQAQRKRDALIAAGIAPSGFGKRKAAQAHRDRKRAGARGERRHKRPWD